MLISIFSEGFSTVQGTQAFSRLKPYVNITYWSDQINGWKVLFNLIFLGVELAIKEYLLLRVTDTYSVESSNSKSYEVNDQLNEGALLCFLGLTDRRVTFGASYTF
ncbi:MAG: hypothetical protein GJ680_21095 [Alteromonadaceae bacterium]|nr:hypothetical protein [Alteromonadaceae bacterium]